MFEVFSAGALGAPPASTLTPARARSVLTQVAADKMRRNFVEFCKRAWVQLLPQPPIWNWHMDAICLPGETPITTERGQMTISNMVNRGFSGRVLSYSHATQRCEWKTVTKLMSSRPQALFNVRFGNDGFLQITGNHPVFVDGHGYVRADLLRVGDVVLHVPQLPSVPRKTTRSKRAGDAVVGRSVISAIEKSVRHCDHLYNLEVADNHNYFAGGLLVHNCDHLSYVTMGEIRFLMINVPPRHSKTMLASVLWPVWHWLHKPGEQFLTGSVDDTLATDSAILARRLVESEWFQALYPGELALFNDENRAGMYRNTKGGYRQTASMQGRITGVGGTIQLLDDPHDAKKVESDVVRLGAIATHDNAWRSRLNNPNTAQKVYIGQRTHDNDIFGHVLEQEGNRWVNLILSMEYSPKKKCITYLNDGTGPKKDRAIFEDPRKLENELLDPKRFSKDTANTEKAIMSERAWQAQYNQEPVGAGGLILKRHWWRAWIQPEWRPNANTERPMPQFSEVIQVYDTAFEEDEEADFSARTTWGVFTNQEVLLDVKTNRPMQGGLRTSLMLLDFWMDKPNFPDLREEAIQANNDFAPDKILVEKKASGHSLIQELRKKNLPVVAVKLAGSSGRGRGQGDLIARAHEASLILERGCVWYPPRRWALEVIEKSSKFPNGPPGSRDIVSTLVIAFQYARRYFDLQFADDEKDEISPWAWRKRETSKPKRYA